MATKLKPCLAKRLPKSTKSSRSSLRKLTNTLPLVGARVPAANCALSKAVAKSSPIPITSPVERISGPRIGSTPRNLLNGNTASFTLKCFGIISLVKFSSFNVLPAITRAAILASGALIALDTNGTVREARGLTSIT